MIEYQIALFLILILIGALNAKPPYRRLSIILFTIGILLVFIPPFIKFILPWDLIIGFTIPVLLWQNARRISNCSWQWNWLGIVFWMAIIAVYILLFTYGNQFQFPGALLFSLVVTGLIYRSGEREEYSSYFSQIGPLVIIFLITESVPEYGELNRYIGDLISGAAIGIFVGIVAVFSGLKLPSIIRSWIAIGQVYAAYWLAYLIGVSAMSSALLSVLVLVGLGLTQGFFEKNKIRPAPLNTQLGFIILLLLFIFLAWQVHQPISGYLLIEVLIGTSIGILTARVGKWLKLGSFINLDISWIAGIKVALFLLPALILWPRVISQFPYQLIMALILTTLILLLSTRITSEVISKSLR